jgi:hypothetical protein
MKVVLQRSGLRSLVCAVLLGAVAAGPAAAQSLIEQAAARLDTVPDVPAGAPLTGQALIDRVSGGPYALTIFPAGIAGTSTWDLDAGEASGTFLVVASGASGDWSTRAFVEGDRLCTRQADGPVCQTVYAYEDGFMEVTEAGEVHAITLPGR